MNKKFFILVFLIIIGVVTAIIINYNNSNKKYSYEVKKIGTPNYFLLLEDNKYGVIDRNGKKIIDTIYDIIEIPDPEKDVFICKNNYNVDTKEYNIHVFNSNNEAILYQYYIVEAIELNNVQDNGFYEKSVLKYKSNGMYGLTDFSGNKITEALYESIEGFEYNEGLLLVKKAGKYGIININGATIIKENYDKIQSDAYWTSESRYSKSGYIVGERSDEGMRYGYIDISRKQLLKNEYNDIYRIGDLQDESSIYLIASKNGKTGVYNGTKNIIKHEYEDITYNAENNLFIFQKNSKQGVAKFDGTMLIPIEYDNIFFAGKYINAQKGEGIDIYDANGEKEANSDFVSKHSYCDNKYEVVSTAQAEYMIINSENKNVTKNGYSYIQYLSNNLFIAKKGNYFGIIDESGNVKIDFKYSIIQPISTYKIVELINEKGQISIINDELQELVQNGTYNFIDDDKYLKISSKKDVTYIDKSGKKVDTYEVFPKNELFAFCQNGKWGFKSKDGNIVVTAQYEYVTEFNEYGFASVETGGMWGSIDKNGNVIKNPTYKLEQEPSFIGEYYLVDLGYGEPYYTN